MKQLKNKFGKILKSCRIRLILMTAGLIAILGYRILVKIPGGAEYVYENIIRPFHGMTATLCDRTDYSVAEIIIAVAVCLFLFYAVSLPIKCLKKKIGITEALCSLVITCLMCFCVIYGGFCILWGVYYSDTNMGVRNLCNISSEGNTHEDMVLTTKYFAELANEYSAKVVRDDAGCYVMNKEAVFDHSYTLYDSVDNLFPGLSATPHYAKEVQASVVMSYMDFTGFFFPFTAEANINTDSPDSMVPSTIAHELAHQRGIAKENEANFIAVVACLEDKNPDYVYSAALLALIHLQNAVYKSGDMDAWQEVRDSYSEGVISDLQQNSDYWKPFRKSVAYKATNSTYDAFLKSYDQEMGIETYGACVDLLVKYYSPEAKKYEKY